MNRLAFRVTSENILYRRTWSVKVFTLPRIFVATTYMYLETLTSCIHMYICMSYNIKRMDDGIQ